MTLPLIRIVEHRIKIPDSLDLHFLPWLWRDVYAASAAAGFSSDPSVHTALANAAVDQFLAKFIFSNVQ